MRYILAAVMVGLALFGSICGQTAQDIERNLGLQHATGRYVFDGINIDVKFDQNGQACEAVWPADGYQGKTFVFGVTKLTLEENQLIFNLIAPPVVRGKNGLIQSVGNQGISDFEYLTLRTAYAYPYFDAQGRLADSEPRQSSINVLPERQVDRPAERVSLVVWKNRTCNE